jgi:hypothetical protein
MLRGDGAWRSLAARGVWDAEVVGSNPAAPTMPVAIRRLAHSAVPSWPSWDDPWAVTRFQLLILWQFAQTTSHFSISASSRSVLHDVTK